MLDLSVVMGDTMQDTKDYCESTVEFADFTFDRQKAVCYGLQNNAGGTTTIINFASERLADRFRNAYLRELNIKIIQNKAQLICFADYQTVMCKSNDDPRVQSLHYNRDYMMGTLSHLM